MSTTNLWRRLKDLLPGEPLLIGTVTEAGTYGANVTLIDGGQVVVRGEAMVGQRVFIRNGVIEGSAPILQMEEIEI